jgi:hypothetical protein
MGFISVHGLPSFSVVRFSGDADVFPSTKLIKRAPRSGRRTWDCHSREFFLVNLSLTPKPAKGLVMAVAVEEDGAKHIDVI